MLKVSRFSEFISQTPVEILDFMFFSAKCERAIYNGECPVFTNSTANIKKPDIILKPNFSLHETTSRGFMLDV